MNLVEEQGAAGGKKELEFEFVRRSWKLYESSVCIFLPHIITIQCLLFQFE